MDIGPNLGVPDPAPYNSPAPVQQKPIAASVDADIGQRFEQMLWAEMLSHAGLEKSLTQSGGESVSAFSRYVVEAIAEDIAEKHPLGLSSPQGGYGQIETSGRDHNV